LLNLDILNSIYVTLKLCAKELRSLLPNFSVFDLLNFRCHFVFLFLIIQNHHVTPLQILKSFNLNTSTYDFGSSKLIYVIFLTNYYYFIIVCPLFCVIQFLRMYSSKIIRRKNYKQSFKMFGLLICHGLLNL
jgi:hypothetical protein